MSGLITPTIILLDSGPLGLVTHPKAGPEALNCQAWHRRLLQASHLVLVPEIIDYEHRREPLLGGAAKARQVQVLDAIKTNGYYLPLTTEAMLQAACFWADVRLAGRATADRHALDADVILAAQAVTLVPHQWEMPGADVLIATTNVGHLTRFTVAQEWQAIQAN